MISKYKIIKIPERASKNTKITNRQNLSNFYTEI